MFEATEQIIFICNGQEDKNIRRSMIETVKSRIRNVTCSTFFMSYSHRAPLLSVQNGVMHDVFVFINDAIEHFSCDFIRCIPYLNFDLNLRSDQLQDVEVNELIHYLTSKNHISSFKQQSMP
jgi:hypothetical protein